MFPAVEFDITTHTEVLYSHLNYCNTEHSEQNNRMLLRLIKSLPAEHRQTVVDKVLLDTRPGVSILICALKLKILNESVVLELIALASQSTLHTLLKHPTELASQFLRSVADCGFSDVVIALAEKCDAQYLCAGLPYVDTSTIKNISPSRAYQMTRSRPGDSLLASIYRKCSNRAFYAIVHNAFSLPDHFFSLYRVGNDIQAVLDAHPGQRRHFVRGLYDEVVSGRYNPQEALSMFISVMSEPRVRIMMEKPLRYIPALNLATIIEADLLSTLRDWVDEYQANAGQPATQPVIFSGSMPPPHMSADENTHFREQLSTHGEFRNRKRGTHHFR